MSATRKAVDAIEMIAQIAGTGAGSTTIAMITSEPDFQAIEAMVVDFQAIEATVVDTAAVDTADPTRVLHRISRTTPTPTTC
jgi:hypothetical protein